MQDEIFKAGVNPGSPGTQTEIKTLICTILSTLKAPMSFMQLYEALSENALVNYFDLVLAVEQLCHSGHLMRGEEVPGGADNYRNTALGEQTGRELNRSVPPSVREKALESSRKVLRRQKRESEVLIRTLPAKEGGFIMEFSIPDSGSDLIRFSLFVPTEEECKLMTKRFLNAPLFIYQRVLALLTGDRRVLGEAYHEEEHLF